MINSPKNGTVRVHAIDDCTAMSPASLRRFWMLGAIICPANFYAAHDSPSEELRVFPLAARALRIEPHEARMRKRKCEMKMQKKKKKMPSDKKFLLISIPMSRSRHPTITADGSHHLLHHFKLSQVSFSVCRSRRSSNKLKTINLGHSFCFNFKRIRFYFFARDFGAAALRLSARPTIS